MTLHEPTSVLTTLSRSETCLNALSRVSRALVAIQDDPAFLAHIVGLVCESFQFGSVSLWLLHPESNALILEHNYSVPVDAPQNQPWPPLSTTDLVHSAAETGEPELDNRALSISRLAIPLRSGNRTVGVLEVRCFESNAFYSEHLTALQILAAQIAIPLTDARNLQENRRQVETLHALHDISLDITSTLERERVLTTILEKAAHLLHAQSSTLGIYDPEAQVLRKIAVHNVPPQVRGIELQLGEGVGGQVMATGEPVIVQDYLQWKERSPQFQEPRLNALLGVPLRWQGHVIGTLDVSDDGARRQFNDDDARLLSLFADLASIAYKNAELFDRVIQLSRELESKVEERTQELVRAQYEISQNAAQLQQLLIATVRVQEEERSRIAQDLHDGSNQLITGALYELQAARLSLSNRRTETSLQKIETVKRLLQEIEAENRRIILGLRPPILDAQGLEPAVRWQVCSLQESQAIACEMQTVGQPVRLAPVIETAVYRIVQESLNNVVTHSHSQHLYILLTFEPQSLYMLIRDLGVGFDLAKIFKRADNRMGLIGMRERAQSIGGTLLIESTPGQGTCITLAVPLTPPTDATQDNI